MGRADHELIVPGLRRHDGPGPADCEPVGLESLGVGALDPEIEGDLWVDLFVDKALAPVEVATREVFRPQTALGVDAWAPAAEACDEVGDDSAILAHRKPRELDAGGPVAVAGHGGIEGLVDVFGDLSGRVTRHLRGIVFRHRLIDIGRKLVDGAIADERLGSLRGSATVFTVAPLAVLTVDGEAGRVDRHSRAPR